VIAKEDKIIGLHIVGSFPAEAMTGFDMYFKNGTPLLIDFFQNDEFE
jgi:hypothetical protein